MYEFQEEHSKLLGLYRQSFARNQGDLIVLITPECDLCLMSSFSKIPLCWMGLPVLGFSAVAL